MTLLHNPFRENGGHMTKEKYMSELTEKLGVFGDEIKNEIVSDYEEHFRMGLASGKSEDQICKELGSIDELVAELNKLTGKEDSKEDNKEWKKNFEFHFDDMTKEKFSKAAENFGDNFNEAVKTFAGLLGSFAANVVKTTERVGGSVGESASQFTGNVSDKAQEFAKSFTAGFENAAGKVADKADKFAKEVARGYNETRNKEAAEASCNTEADWETLSTNENNAASEKKECEDCDSVIIEADCADITISDSEDGKVRFNYTNHGSVNQQLAYRFDFHQEGRTIYATVKKRPGATNFFKSMSCPDIELEVFLPEGLKNVSVGTMSGEIKADDVSVEQFCIKTMSGDIDIDNCVFKALEGTTMSGDISTEDCGAVSASFSTVSGDLDFAGNAESINAKTTSGDLNLTCTGAADITANSISGDVEVELEGVGGYLAHVKTTCGDIDLNWQDESLEIIRGGSYVMGSGEVKVNATTVSGDISIEA